MDFSLAGIKQGLIKAATVAVYVGASGAIAALIAYVSDIQINADDAWTAALILVINAVLAGIQKWLSTHSPE